MHEREKLLRSSANCCTRAPDETTSDLNTYYTPKLSFVNPGRIVQKGECVMRFYVNKQAQPNGDHEVHRENCYRLPSLDNRLYLGDFYSSVHALREARKYYPKADGCYYCCSEIHRS